MLDQIHRTLLEHLRALYEEGGSGNFLVAQVDRYYVQVAGNRGEAQAQLEAVSNEFLPSAYQLDDAQKQELRRRGFTLDGGGNYGQQIDIFTDASRAAVCDLSLDTLAEIFGTDLADIEFDVNLADMARLDNQYLREMFEAGAPPTAIDEEIANAFFYIPLREDEQSGYFGPFYHPEQGAALLSDDTAYHAMAEHFGEHPYVQAAMGRELMANPIDDPNFGPDLAVTINPFGPFTIRLSPKRVRRILAL